MRALMIVIATFAAPAAAMAQSPEGKFLELINAYRKANGLGTLVITPKLTTAAVWMSTDMAAKDYMSHTDSQGRDPFQRMADLGYDFNTAKGENLAAGQTTAQEAFDAWKNSPGHNANMLNASFKAIGIARVYGAGSTYGYYWTTNFGGYVDGIGAPPPTSGPAPGTSAPGGSPIREFQRAVRENEPWSSFAVFSAAATATSRMVTGRLAKASLPLAVGIAAVQLARGQASPRDIAISAGSYAAAGLAVGLIADGLIYPALFAAGPPGWIAAGIYTLAKFGATWYLGSKLEGWVRGFLDRGGLDRIREGVKEKIETIAP